MIFIENDLLLTSFISKTASSHQCFNYDPLKTRVPRLAWITSTLCCVRTERNLQAIIFPIWVVCKSIRPPVPPSQPLPLLRCHNGNLFFAQVTPISRLHEPDSAMVTSIHLEPKQHLCVNSCRTKKKESVRTSQKRAGATEESGAQRGRFFLSPPPSDPAEHSISPFSPHFPPIFLSLSLSLSLFLKLTSGRGSKHDNRKASLRSALSGCPLLRSLETQISRRSEEKEPHRILSAGAQRE